MACGATGAIAGIFKSPIAAMIFSLEVLMLDLTMWSIIPLLISAVTGATVATLLLGQRCSLLFYPPGAFSYREYTMVYPAGHNSRNGFILFHMVFYES
jgi:H+/Cl- antiporter ClcA